MSLHILLLIVAIAVPQLQYASAQPPQQQPQPDPTPPPRPPNATCTALDTLIQNRNTSRVSNCARAENCTWVICNVSGLNAGVSANASFSACQGPPYAAGIELILRTVGAFNALITSTRSTFSTNDSSIVVSSSTTLNITVNQTMNGINFEAFLLESGNRVELFQATDVPLTCGANMSSAALSVLTMMLATLAIFQRLL